MDKSAIAGDRSSTNELPKNRFYRTVWRWHFYAGLFVIPFMVVLAVTGIVYLFKPQLDAVMYHNLMFVQPQTTMLSYTNQVQLARQAYPDGTVTQITPSIAPDRSTEILLTTSDGRKLRTFINPYTGKVLGDRDEDKNLQSIVLKIHGELLLGKFGDYLVELAACWGLVLLLTGLFLWYPRHNRSILGIWIPRLWSQNKRVFWRDLHAVPGFYGVLAIAFLILTGLPWTGFWGDTFTRVWGQFPAQMSNDIPKSAVLTGSLNQQGKVVPWAVEQLPMPESKASKHEHHSSTKSSPDNSTPNDTFNLNSAIALAQAKGAPPGFSVTLPEGKTGVYTISAFPNDPTQEVTIHLDRYSGKVLAEVRWQDYGLVPKAVEMGIAIHTGKYFGLANQLLMLIACLILILLSISGFILWWQRRPEKFGAIGAPAMLYMQSWRVPLAIVAVLGLAFPLVGLSLVIVLLLDYFLLSRIPKLRKIFN
jgi:uncharacterized iron-regulated membrane protein